MAFDFFRRATKFKNPQAVPLEAQASQLRLRMRAFEAILCDDVSEISVGVSIFQQMKRSSYVSECQRREE